MRLDEVSIDGFKKEWEDLCAKYRMSRVRVWTLDDDMAGLDRAVVARRRVT